MNFINTFGVLGKTEVSNIMARGRDKPYKDSRFQFFQWVHIFCELENTFCL